MLTRDEIVREAGQRGFAPEPYEKVIRLVGLLRALRQHPFLRKRLALKGGTALNVFPALRWKALNVRQHRGS